MKQIKSTLMIKNYEFEVSSKLESNLALETPKLITLWAKRQLKQILPYKGSQIKQKLLSYQKRNIWFMKTNIQLTQTLRCSMQ